MSKSIDAPQWYKKTCSRVFIYLAQWKKKFNFHRHFLPKVPQCLYRIFRTDWNWTENSISSPYGEQFNIHLLKFCTCMHCIFFWYWGYGSNSCWWKVPARSQIIDQVDEVLLAPNLCTSKEGGIISVDTNSAARETTQRNPLLCHHCQSHVSFWQI